MKQVLTNVYDNCEITDANVCVWRGLLEIRGEDYTSYSTVCPPPSCPSKEPELSPVFGFKGENPSYLFNFDYYINSIKSGSVGESIGAFMKWL